MHKSIFSFITIPFLFFTPMLNAQDEMPPDQKAWMEYMTPGPMHELMAKSIGEWKTVNTHWMEPGAEPMVYEGTATVEMIMGNRYQKATHKGTIMGMPFEGVNLQGYDNKTGEFISVWIDNLGTGVSVSKGTYDEENETITSFGSMINPADGKELQYKSTQQIIDDNNQVYEMFLIEDGKEFKNMNVKLTR